MVFLNIDGSFGPAAGRLIGKVKSLDRRVATVAITSGDANTPQARAADFALEVPEGLARLPGILAECNCAAHLVTSHRELEQKLADVQRQIQIMLDRLTEGVAVIDPSGTIIRVNRKLLAIYCAQDPSAFLGKACHEALWGLPKPCDDCPRRAGVERIEDARIVRMGDRALNLDVCISELSDGRGGTAGMIESIRDATPRLKLEENLLESEKMKSVAMMAAGLAHELRNPIAIISATAEYCLEIQDNEELESGCTSIMNAAAQAEKVISDLLNFTSPAPAQFEPVSLNELLSSTAQMVAAQGAAQGVKITPDLPPSLPPVNAERSRLQQALLNFMLNGIEAMGCGGTLTIEAESTEDESAEIRITDTGCGMTPEELQRAFEPFFTTKGGGVGLGMPNAGRIIKAHKGQVMLYSEAGEGTTVRIVLPAAQRAADVPVGAA